MSPRNHPVHDPAPSAPQEDSAYLSLIIETQNDLAAVELEPRIVLEMITSRSQKMTGADGAAIQLIEGDKLICSTGVGTLQSLRGTNIDRAASICARAIQSGDFQLVEDCQSDPDIPDARSILAVPLIFNNHPIGAITVASRRAGAFSEQHVSALRLMAGLAAASLGHASEFEIKKKLLIERTGALCSLRESQEQFRNAFEHAAIGMALVSLDGRWLQVNPSMCRLLGYAEHELLVTDFQSLTYHEDIDADLANARQLIAGQIPDYQMVKRYVHRQGHLVWAMLSVSLMRDDAGQPAYFISQIQDITKQQIAQEALRQSEDEYRAIFELAGVGKVQTDLTTGRFLRVNEKLCQIMGYSAIELQSKSFGQLIHPDDIEACRDAVRQILNGEISDVNLEMRCIHKDGRVIWMMVNATALKDSSGRLTRAVSTLQDITQRKQAEWLEHDRMRVLEMVALGEPLKKVFDQLAETIERQIDGARAMIMVLEDGNFSLHGPTLPAIWHDALHIHTVSIASQLAAGIWESTDICGVTAIANDAVWRELRPLAAKQAITACWAVAIRSNDGTSLGLLNVFRNQNRRPTPTELQTLDLCSKLATICIDHHHATGQLSHLAKHDQLTGLPNRMMFEDRIQQALALAARSQKHVALMLLDIDEFKGINDSLGHNAGDHLLQQFGQRLSILLRETDTMARIGGDEFAIILPELDGPDGATIVADRIVKSLADSFNVGIHTIRITTSIGIAVRPLDGNDPVTLMGKADAALYHVKKTGRNGFALARTDNRCDA